jgi:succinate dehydrogenase / fumarate reductase cytochrome b subunit
MNITIQKSVAGTPTAMVNDRSVGKKILMAVSGLIAFGFVVGHMVGNLQVFAGQDQLNSYAEALHSMGPLIWVVRAFLLVFLIIHIWKGIQLKLENWSSRPISYTRRTMIQATLASRTMIWTGLTIAAFVTYHLLHFTFQITNPEYQQMTDPLGRPDVYSMVISGFSNVFISIVYIIAVGLLCFHLTHAFASMFQTVGWANSGTLPKLEKAGLAISIVLFLGYISIPVAVMLKLVSLPEGGM